MCVPNFHLTWPNVSAVERAIEQSKDQNLTNEALLNHHKIPSDHTHTYSQLHIQNKNEQKNQHLQYIRNENMQKFIAQESHYSTSH